MLSTRTLNRPNNMMRQEKMINCFFTAAVAAKNRFTSRQPNSPPTTARYVISPTARFEKNHSSVGMTYLPLERDEVKLNHLMVENRFTRADQDDFWLDQPKVMNLIAFRVIEQLYGFFRTHVALCASRSAMWCIGQAAQRRRWTDFPHPDGNHDGDMFDERAGRFCPLASLACACGE